MSSGLKEILKSKTFNAWGLFWLITVPISVAMVIAMLIKDTSTPDSVSSMIQLSVRCAVPWLYIAFAASAVQKLFPGHFGRWLLRNRKYFGLCFAAAMAWQGLFILWLVLGHTDYYVNEVYVLRDAIEGLGGYLFLGAMTLTSFPWGRKLLKPKQWRMLHLSGIYFLWAYAFSVYWWSLFYYSNPVPLDYIYYWAGLAVWVLRAAAWTKKRSMASLVPSPIAKAAGVLLIGGGFVAASIGSAWQGAAEAYLYGYAITEIPELYLPYWPFEPFMSLAVMLLGMLLWKSAEPSRPQVGARHASPAALDTPAPRFHIHDGHGRGVPRPYQRHTAKPSPRSIAKMHAPEIQSAACAVWQRWLSNWNGGSTNPHISPVCGVLVEGFCSRFVLATKGVVNAAAEGAGANLGQKIQPSVFAGSARWVYC